MGTFAPAHAAFAGVVSDDAGTAEDSFGAAVGTGSGVVDTGTGTGAGGAGRAPDAVAGPFLPESFGFCEITDGALLVSFSEPLSPAAAPEGLVSLAAAESREAHIAAKLPVLRVDEFARPAKAGADSGATLLVIAGSMAEVKVKSPSRC